MTRWNKRVSTLQGLLRRRVCRLPVFHDEVEGCARNKYEPKEEKWIGAFAASSRRKHATSSRAGTAFTFQFRASHGCTGCHQNKSWFRRPCSTLVLSRGRSRPAGLWRRALRRSLPDSQRVPLFLCRLSLSSYPRSQHLQRDWPHSTSGSE